MEILEKNFNGPDWSVRVAINSNEAVFLHYPKDGLPSDSDILIETQRLLDARLITPTQLPVIVLNELEWNEIVDELESAQTQINELQAQLLQLIQIATK